ncbi:hypothetical protein Sdagh_06310 [Streptomyces daghestanicus]|uniref:Uncharacterized protein n=1 Tax=Streptomyces daghestanicus TaxID=66885 RepID=A0ABQ3PV46_9ACTN|nr:hypothetical protein Sdagh_06310 [Streptomyces daghestanicus]
MEQVGGVDLPVTVPQGPAARAGDHRYKSGTEPVVVGVVRSPGVLLTGRPPGDTGLHNPTPSVRRGP